MKFFVSIFFMSLLVVILLFCSLMYATYRLIKLYKTGANNNSLKSGWRSILNHLIIFPVVCYVFNKNTMPAYILGNEYEFGYYVGTLIGEVIGFHFIFWWLTHLMPWLITWFQSKFQPKEMSANIFGFFILIFWIPVNGMSILAAQDLYTIYHTKKNDSYNITQVVLYAKKNQGDFVELVFKKHGFYDIAELNENTFFDKYKFFDGLPLSLAETKNLRKIIIEKTKKLEKLHTWWKSKYYDKLEIFDVKFDEALNEFFSKYYEWHKISKKDQDKFIASFKFSFKESFVKSRSVLKQYDIHSPWEFKLYTYKTAITLLDLSLASNNADTEQKLLQIETDFNNNIDIINHYVKKENEFNSKVNSILSNLT